MVGQMNKPETFFYRNVMLFIFYILGTLEVRSDDRPILDRLMRRAIYRYTEVIEGLD